MSVEDLKKLRTERSFIKCKITRLYNLCCFENIAEETLVNLQAKKSKMELYFSEYENINKQIFILNSSDSEEYQSTDSKYYDAMSILSDAIASKNYISTDTSRVKTKLPTININKFTGKYSEYPDFIQLFNSLIHNDKNLDNIQRLHYLRQFLEGEPYNLIKGLSLTSKGYDDAITTLNDRYYNKFKISTEFIGALLDLKPIQRSMPSVIREFVGSLKQGLAQIKNIGINIENWDPILMVILQWKLDAYTSRAYQLERDFNAEPKVSDFISYFEHRSLALENAEGAPRMQISRQLQRENVAVNWAAAKPSLAINCNYCVAAFTVPAA
ncbi:hypothetical protein evm_014665 [Chilo suppressalis]|nr:hypothetical protein evm_014665 [Chilo suppressalis]